MKGGSISHRKCGVFSQWVYCQVELTILSRSLIEMVHDIQFLGFEKCLLGEFHSLEKENRHGQSLPVLEAE